MDRFDPWAVLGVGPEASPVEVKAAWRSLAVQFHPDRYAAAGAGDQQRAAVHMTAINIAYDEIRSGRALRVSGAPSAAAAGFGQGGGAGPWSTQDPDLGWFDDEVLVAALLRAEQRQRSSRHRWRLRVVAAVAVLVVLGVLFHLAMLRTYHYDFVYDGLGNTYQDVDCGNGYDRGKTTANELRALAATSPSGSDLLRKAEVVELVCDDWTGVAGLLGLPAGASRSLGVSYLLLFRRRR